MKIGLLTSRLYLFICLLFICNVSAQKIDVVNQGDVYIGKGTEVAIVANFDNKKSGNFLNDGEVDFYYDFNNDGIVFYQEENSGYSRFIGTETQKISGIGSSDFNDLLFDNVGTELEGEIKVVGEVEFVKGIVKNSDNKGTFVFEESGLHKHASDASYVQGKVTKVGDEFEFPVGDGGYYRPNMIHPFEGGDSNLGSYGSQYFYKSLASDNKEESIVYLDNKEYWEITKDNVNSSNIIELKLTWDERTTPSEIFTEKEGTSMAIVRWDESKKMWIIEKGSEVDIVNKIVKVPLAPLLSAKVSFTLARIRKESSSGSDGVEVFNAISAINDRFYIAGLDEFPDNILEIYNRWGVKVFGTTRYGVDDNWFTGTSKQGGKLPTGVYFYVLEYNTLAGEKENKTGYLYID